MQDNESHLKHVGRESLETLAVKLNLQEVSVCPFQQTPSENGSGPAGSWIGGHELFSLFTADIIRQKTIFTR